MANGPAGMTGGEWKGAQAYQSSITPRPGNTNTGGGGGGFNLGGLFGSLGSAYAARKQAQIAEANRKFQEEQNTIAYERSLPWSSYGPAGDVEFDPETREILQTLDPQFQSLMQGYLGSAAMANQELQSMMGDPYAMEQQQFQRFEDLNANAYAQSRLQGQEAALAQGRTGTQGYYDQLAIEDSINQSRLGGQMQSMKTGMDYRNMLAAESKDFGGASMNVAGMLTPQADLARLVGQGSHTGKNMEGVALSGHNYADTKSGFWSGMQDQAALYNNQGQLTREAKTGWGTGLMNAGKQFFSLLS
jgi:hypothetical protein